MTPDLSQPDSVSLTCSVASPPTDDYQYQWQWLKSGTLLNSSDTPFTITHTTIPGRGVVGGAEGVVGEEVVCVGVTVVSGPHELA